jgi:hypothetical protein
VQSYLLNSIFTHRSARYALEGVLKGFATDAALNALPDPNIILFSERNSEAMNAPDNSTYGNITQDDYDTWVGEAALVRWGSRAYGNQGWIRYNRQRQRCKLCLHRWPRRLFAVEQSAPRSISRSRSPPAARQPAGVKMCRWSLP